MNIPYYEQTTDVHVGNTEISVRPTIQVIHASLLTFPQQPSPGPASFR
jgi:hypothetical protein